MEISNIKTKKKGGKKSGGFGKRIFLSKIRRENRNKRGVKAGSARVF